MKVSIDPSKYKGIARTELNYFADIVELITLISKVDIGVGEILDRFTETNLITDGEARINDSNESWVKEIFSLLELRRRVFSETYPFDYDNLHQTLILKDDLTIKNKLYVQLLLSANLPFFNNNIQELTTDFENVSFYAIQGYFEGATNTRKFGKRSSFKGNLRDRINQLAKEINIKINEEYLNQISVRNNQEAGLDIISWFSFDDNWGNLIVVLGQCACVNVGWHKKQIDTVPYLHLFNFRGIKPIQSLFIPHSLLKHNSFFKSINISDTLLFDRKRIVDSFREEEYHNLESDEIVKYVIEYMEDVV